MIQDEKQESAFELIREEVGLRCGGLLAAVITFRLIVARVGEEDTFRWWPSRLSEAGDLALSAFFRRTWPRQKLLLSLEAAAEAERAELARTPGKVRLSLFRLDPVLDASAEHVLRTLPVERCIALEEHLRQIVDDREPGFAAACEAAAKSVDRGDELASSFAALCHAYSTVDVRQWQPPSLGE